MSEEPWFVRRLRSRLAVLDLLASFHEECDEPCASDCLEHSAITGDHSRFYRTCDAIFAQTALAEKALAKAKKAYETIMTLIIDFNDAAEKSHE